MAQYDYDLFTIGAGSGGVRASRLAAMAGAKVAVAEEHKPGGTCVVRGCIPKKLFVYASGFADEFEDAGAFGWKMEKPEFNWLTLRDAVQTEVDRLARAYERNLKLAGGELINDRAILKDQHTVHLVGENRDVTAEKILVATGGWPHLPQDVLGIEHAVSSNEMFLLDNLPKRLVVVGGGYIAVEFAFIMRGLGVDVTLLYRGTEVLRGFDWDLRVMVRHEMEAKGIRVMLETDVKCVEKNGDGFVVISKAEREFPCELVLYATGRRPNTSDIGLEDAGVELDGHGAIKVDKYSQTSAPSIFAIGDVTDRMALTPIALREGIAFAETHIKNNPSEMDYANVPTAVFSQPPLGTVGMSEADARDAGHEVHIYKTSFRAMKASFADRDEQTFMKLVVDAKTDLVLGAHIMGHEAGEMIQMLGIAVKKGVTKAEVDATVSVHPTAAEELVTMRERFVDDEVEVDHTGHQAEPQIKRD